MPQTIQSLDSGTYKFQTILFGYLDPLGVGFMRQLRLGGLGCQGSAGREHRGLGSCEV